MRLDYHLHGDDEQLRAVNAMLNSGEIQGTGNSNGGLTLSVSKGQAHDALTAFQALASRLSLRISTAPEIVVLNDHPANLFVGQNIYYWQEIERLIHSFLGTRRRPARDPAADRWELGDHRRERGR